MTTAPLTAVSSTTLPSSLPAADQSEHFQESPTDNIVSPKCPDPDHTELEKVDGGSETETENLLEKVDGDSETETENVSRQACESSDMQIESGEPDSAVSES